MTGLYQIVLRNGGHYITLHYYTLQDSNLPDRSMRRDTERKVPKTASLKSSHSKDEALETPRCFAKHYFTIRRQMKSF